LNQKGGSCKTAVSVNLAAALAEKGKRVLLIDLDPQTSASIWLGFRNPSKALFTFSTDNDENVSINSIAEKTNIERLDIIAGSPWLMSADKVLANEMGAEGILRRKIEKLKIKPWDFVLIDNQPSLGIVPLNALTASNRVLVPMELNIMGTTGLAQLLNTIATVKERLNPSIELEGIVACRTNFKTKLSKDISADLRKRFGNKIYETSIRENIRVAESMSFGKPIIAYDSKSMGAQDFRALADEFIKRRKKK
jgi:chromosome partitioning protein